MVAMLLGLAGLANAQDVVAQSVEPKAESKIEAKVEIKVEEKSEAKVETKVEVEVKANCLNVRYVKVVAATSSIRKMYLKFFDSKLPIDNGTGVRQESAVEPSLAFTKEDKELILPPVKEPSMEISEISENGEQATLVYVIIANGESQLRQKSWLGLRDDLIVVTRNGSIVYQADSVSGAVVSEVTEKCF